MKKIQDESAGYFALKAFVRFLYPKFFREIEIRGVQNIPENGPVIFAGNHQNALMDTLGILLFQKDSIVFMARADIFKSALNRKLLRFLKLSPIFRIRDGYENLAKNREQMNVATEVLLSGKRLCLMPEGNQGRQHKLRPLVKGLFRIAYTAEEQMNGMSHVRIIPVGIDYSYYQHAGTDLVITYGKPIEVENFMPFYRENAANGLNALRNTLAETLSSQMHDIRSIDYERTYRLCCYGVPAYLEHQAENGMHTNATTMGGLRFDARFALGKIFDRMETEKPDEMEELSTWCQKLNQLPGYPNEIAEWMEERPTKAYSIILGILAVILTPGFVLNFPGWYLNRTIVKKVEDTQMHSTFAFTMGVLFNFIVYVIAAVIIGTFMKATFMQVLVLLLFIGVWGIVSERARQALRLPWRRLKYAYGKRKMVLNACKADYMQLKKKIRSILLNR
jgi:1-acyl-sn-glycerol-3-phosphate acyltransferase